MNWKEAAGVFRWRWRVAEKVAERNIDRFIHAHERVQQLETALEEIASCNDGRGYMPELAQKALGRTR